VYILYMVWQIINILAVLSFNLDPHDTQAL